MTRTPSAIEAAARSRYPEIRARKKATIGCRSPTMPTNRSAGPPGRGSNSGTPAESRRTSRSVAGTSGSAASTCASTGLPSPQEGRRRCLRRRRPRQNVPKRPTRFRAFRIVPLALLLLLALGAGATVTIAVWRYPSAPFVPTRPTEAATEAVGHTLAHHSRLRRLLVGRLDPEVATGLALTLALGLIVLGGLVLAVLAYLVRSSDRLVEARRERRRVGLRPRQRPLETGCTSSRRLARPGS